jgi:hypothetical protein
VSRVNPILLVIGLGFVSFSMGIIAWLLFTKVVRWLLDRFLPKRQN